MARWLRLTVCVVAVASVMACSAAGAPEPWPSATGRAEPVNGIAVAGNQFVDEQGRPVRLRGFNHAGAEFACIEGDGFFDTPDGQAPGEQIVAAMRSWVGADAVRVPLNEQCWLGLPAAPAAYSGAAYRKAIRDFVARLNENGFVVILDLHRSAPADGVSREQEQMPDRDHSVDFWRSVAGEFRSGAVIFDLFNEPFPYAETDTDRAWACWQSGGCELTSANTGRPYLAAGMNELVAAVRSTGSRTVLLAGGIHWAESMTRWLRDRPVDPAGQLAASFHAYSFNTFCADVACYNRDLAPIAAEVPLLTGEIGPTLRIDPRRVDENCPASAVRRGGWAATTLDWLDAHQVSWTGWSWNPWGDCWSLVRDWRGEPTRTWGAEVRRRLATE